MALIWTWGPVCLLIALPSIATSLAGVFYHRTRSRHDHAIEDDLPQTAGDWLRDRLGGSLRAVVTDEQARSASDGYYVFHELIQLTDETHFKADPTYWAIAAHELGHARLHQRHVIGSALISGMQIVTRVLVALALGVMVGDLMFALPGALDVCFALLVTALVLHVGELVNEAYASLWAYAELRRSAHLTPRHLRAVRGVLLAAFGTYATSFLAHGLLLTRWSVVETLVGRGHLVEVARLTTLGWIAAGVASLIVISHAVRAVHRIVRGPPRRANPIRDAIGKVAIVALIYLAWNLRADPGWAWCVMLAAVPVANLFLAVLVLPTVPVRVWFASKALQWRGPGIERSRAWTRARAAGKAMIKHGNRTIAAIVDNPRASGAAPLYALTGLTYLPLVIALWLGGGG